MTKRGCSSTRCSVLIKKSQNCLTTSFPIEQRSLMKRGCSSTAQPAVPSPCSPLLNSRPRAWWHPARLEQARLTDVGGSFSAISATTGRAAISAQIRSEGKGQPPSSSARPDQGRPGRLGWCGRPVGAVGRPKDRRRRAGELRSGASRRCLFFTDRFVDLAVAYCVIILAMEG